MKSFCNFSPKAPKGTNFAMSVSNSTKTYSFESFLYLVYLNFIASLLIFVLTSLDMVGRSTLSKIFNSFLRSLSI